MFSNFLPYHDFSNTIVHRDSPIIVDTDCFDNVFLRITHPYDVNAFDHFLFKHDLTYFYSLFVPNLRNGFPLGAMPLLTDTVIFKNHPSTLLYSDVVHKYLADELVAGRMLGPFSLQQAEKFLRGAIFCSPLLVSVQTQQPGMPDKLHVCRHLSKGDKDTPSMNSHIHKDDFPTRFDTALRVADIVGLFFFSARRQHLFPPLLMGFTSGGLLFHGFHIWWSYYLHGFHIWWPSSSRVHIWWPALHGFTSGGPSYHAYFSCHLDSSFLFFDHPNLILFLLIQVTNTPPGEMLDLH